MAKNDVFKKDLKSYKKYIDDLYYKITKDIRSVILSVLPSMGLMQEDTYDKNHNGKVDIAESATCGDNNTISFAIDPTTQKWGYKKDGADTVYPFKDGDGDVDPSDATAQSVYVLDGYTFYAGDNNKKTGSMPNIGILEKTLPAKSTNITRSGHYTVTVPGEVVRSSDTGYIEGTSITGPEITINVDVGSGVNLQSKTVSPTTSQQIVEPDEEYDGLSDVTVNAVSLQVRTVTPSLQEQVITPQSFPGSTYIGLSQVTVEAIENKGTPTVNFSARPDVTYTSNGTYTLPARMTSVGGGNYTGYHEGIKASDPMFTVTVNVPLQSKTVSGMTPSANWSGAYTSEYVISPDSGYDGMSSVSVTVPMIRDYSLFTVSTVETPSTIYNGDTAQSNSTKMLRIAPTKTGMVYTNSYLELGPSSYMGNATPADVLSGKTFSSSNGIQLTGTNSGGITPTGNVDLGTISSNGSKTGYDVSSYATCSFTVNVQTGGNIQSRKDADLVRYDSTMNVQPDTGYDGIRYVGIPSLKSCMVNLWSNSSSSSTFAGQTITLSQAWTLFSAIIIYYKPHRDNTSGYYYSVLLEYSTINAHNNTSTAKFALSGRASQSASATSGSMFERPFRFASSTTITFGGGTQAGSTTTSNNVMIPVSVYGIY